MVLTLFIVEIIYNIITLYKIVRGEFFSFLYLYYINRNK